MKGLWAEWELGTGISNMIHLFDLRQYLYI
jgi:hypothetical protein